MSDIAALEAGLDSFDAAERRQSLRKLVERRTPPPRGGNVNMHFHSFYSYNAEGWSPSHIAWAASSRGLYAAGLCDFDVLDGLEEFLSAGLMTGLRSCVYLETRAFVAALGDVDINSPGEHGVAYAMGAGFRCVPEPADPAASGLESLRRTARERNTALLARMAAAVPDVPLDYDRHVLPLTPAGVATERHIIRAFVDRALSTTGGAAAAGFFADLLGKDTAATETLLGQRSTLEEAVRSRLVKRGGRAYAAPNETTFPSLESFFSWVSGTGAMPMAAWLDGTSGGESDADRFLDVMAGAGACSLNIIPDRNWNVTDPADRARKVTKLREIVSAARRRDMPINIGTEMNRAGLPFADDLDGPTLREHKELFLLGARVLVGQAVLHRYAGLSYPTDRAKAEIGSSIASRNAFFASVGALPPLEERTARHLEDEGQEWALGAIRDSARAGRWTA